MYLGVVDMIADLFVLAVFALSVFFSMRRGFAMTLAGFLKGIAAVVLAWIFCDDLAAILLDIPTLHDFAVGRISAGLSARWESSAVYNALPKLFTEGENGITDALINEGVTKLSLLFFTILGFFLILIGIRLFVRLLEKALSHKHRGGFIGFSDRLLGLLLGIIVGAFNVLLALALLLPLAGLFLPSLSESIPAWFENSHFAREIYDNNLLLILMRDFLA